MEDGLYEFYFESGQLAEKVYFREGDLHGPYEDFYETGKLKEKKNFKDGKQF